MTKERCGCPECKQAFPEPLNLQSLSTKLPGARDAHAPVDRLFPGAGEQALYLTDLRLDLSGVAHGTPGLFKMAESRLAAIVFDLPAFRRTDEGHFDGRQCPPLEDEFDHGENMGEEVSGTACAITLLRFRNLLNVPARVTARTSSGASVSKIFRAGETRTLLLRGPKGLAIRGGLGRCVTIQVEIENVLGEWVTLSQQLVCCDINKAGDILVDVPEAKPLPGQPVQPSAAPSQELLLIVSIVE